MGTSRGAGRQPAWVPVAVDVGVAAGASVLVQLAVWRGGGADETFADRPLTSLIFLAVSLSLLARRRFPLVVAVVAAAGVVSQSVLSDVFAQSPALALCLGVVLYSVGAYGTTRAAVLGGLVIAGALQLKTVLTPPAVADDSPFVALFWWLLCASVVGLGVLVRSVRGSAHLRLEAMRREEERAAHARAAVVEERQRIARELHDVVSHNVSASIVQAGAAEELLHRDPERAGVALRSIQDLGREAMGEMRRLLGVMTGGSDDGLAPQPRIADLPVLLARSREAGIAATLVMDHALPELGGGLELSVYRIVQEALTNVRRHAQATSVVVQVRHDEYCLEVEVTDDGQGAPAEYHGTGHGLRGMRERVEVFGGELHAGSAENGGFMVRARIPVTARRP